MRKCDLSGVYNTDMECVCVCAGMSGTAIAVLLMMTLVPDGI